MREDLQLTLFLPERAKLAHACASLFLQTMSLFFTDLLKVVVNIAIWEIAFCFRLLAGRAWRLGFQFYVLDERGMDYRGMLVYCRMIQTATTFETRDWAFN